MIENILKNNYNYGKIELFSIGHIIMVLITILFSIYVLKNKNKISNLNTKQVQNIRVILASILIINMIVRRGSYIFFGYYDWHYNLDINFCNFTSILFLIYLLTSNKKIYNYCYYMIFVGPLLSIILPSTNLYLSNYSFYSFLIIHHLLFVSNLIFMCIEKKDYLSNDFYNAHLFIIIYMIIVFIFDFIMKTTYNIPLTFVNVKILDNSIIDFICKYHIIPYLIMVIVMEIFMQIGRIILKKYNYKKV